MIFPVGGNLTMDHLWAPWRLSYVSTNPPPNPGNPCFICRALECTDGPEADRANLLLWRRPLSAVVLNRFPYNNGHLLVVPNRHIGQFEELSDAEHLEMMDSLRVLQGIIRTSMQAEGFNIGLNLGRTAGAGVPGHLHWHLVPRWFGDTNFMPILTDTKVVVQALDALYDLLSRQLPTAA